MKQEHLVYPNLDVICRLCLKEDSGTVCIFPDQQLKTEETQAKLSIPMRIMACAALEVQTTDDLPKKICTECRFQLEKSYLFRKQSQASDSKLRKHLRLIGLGKTSKVFRKSTYEDDDGDDEEGKFHDSLEFIKRHEEKAQMEQQVIMKTLETKWKIQNDIELERFKAQLKAKCKAELKSEFEESARMQLKEEIQEEMEKDIIPKLKVECFEQARISIREEVKTECRQTEMQALLEDLQRYLNGKQSDSANSIASSVSKTNEDLTHDTGEKNVISFEYTKKLEEPFEGTAKSTKCQKKSLIDIKAEIMLSDNPSNISANINDDEGDSDNFLIYDTDEGLEVQRKSEAGTINKDVEGFMHGYESEDCQIDNQNDAKASSISYSIEDSENGEITFFKKSNEIAGAHRPNVDSNDDQPNISNIVVINYPDDIDDEEHLDMIDFIEDEDGGNKEPSQQIKCYKPKDSKRSMSPNMSKANSVKSEDWFIAKTYISHVQRQYDTPKSFECIECPMMFSTQNSLDRHLKIHQREGIKNQCPECQIVVSCSSALRRHMYIHCDQKPFPCMECGKAFVQKEILKRHMQIHTGIKPHKCPHCDRAFAQRINLRQHINRHHMEEPRILQHSCHLCPKRFNHASGLSRHLASHNGIAFQCSECERTFGDKSSIKRHIANKHGNGRIEKSEKHVESI